MLSAISFNLDQFRFLLSGNGLSSGLTWSTKQSRSTLTCQKPDIHISFAKPQFLYLPQWSGGGDTGIALAICLFVWCTTLKLYYTNVAHDLRRCTICPSVHPSICPFIDTKMFCEICVLWHFSVTKLKIYTLVLYLSWTCVYALCCRMISLWTLKFFCFHALPEKNMFDLVFWNLIQMLLMTQGSASDKVPVGDV